MGVLLRKAWWVASARSHWLAIILGLEGAVAIIAISTAGRLPLAAAMAVGPLLACARYDVRVTAMVMCCALALSAIAVAVTSVKSLGKPQDPLLTVLLIGLFAILVAAIRGRRESRLIHIAENVQRAILRPLPAELGGVAFASHYQSATPGTLVGGDLYDLTMTQYGPRLIVGDVKGKGLDAVGRCAAVIATFREFAFAEPDLVALAERMDARLSAELGLEDFVTAVLAEFTAGEVRLVNCGHQPPVKACASASLEIISPLSAVPPLGLHPRPARQDVALKAGERLLFYTDGLVEARDRAGRFLMLDERLACALAAAKLDACVRGVARLLLAHAGRSLGDDVLLVVCEPLG